MSSIATPPVYKISVIQSLVVLCLTGLVAGIWGRTEAWSLLLGGMISVIPNAYFAHRVFRESGARAMDNIVRNVYLGEVGKLVLAATGFALVFRLMRPLEEVFLFSGFFVIHLVGVIATARLVLARQ